ncbi:MAG: isocitrate/isopropylmalate dehydrogenase family protein [Dehalococcoidia bacterium]|nr:isocitrate/isopropylmalate dehydrogenase family protein [Dehalococcoidia bacterium]MDD5495207.1 isocitrate/isopropylmalate dehydrogenase family protein [Dehalococcoidia bacterium]
MTYRITLLPGDGIGPEITEATLRVLDATGVKFDWDVFTVGEAAIEKYGTPLPDDAIQSIRKNKVALKGPVTTPIGTGFRSVNVALRKKLDLYACLRPCKSYPGVVTTPYRDVDIVVVRENTEDLYIGIEFEKGTPEAARLYDLITQSFKDPLRSDAGYSIKTISESGSRRIVKYAFDYARKYKRKKVSAVSKANIMKFTDGLFLSVAREVAKAYPEIEYEEVLVDALCMRLVRSPKLYDVLVLPNLYGDIISDLCAGLVGGLGLAPGANIGDEAALFEPTHGSAPKYTGMNKVSPMAQMLSAVLMLRYLNEEKAADRMEHAIASVIAEGKNVTYDLRRDRNEPSVGTSQVADAVIKMMRS